MNLSNSRQLVNKLKILEVRKNYILVSDDVFGMFTNISLDVALAGLVANFHKITKTCPIPYGTLVKTIRICMEDA